MMKLSIIVISLIVVLFTASSNAAATTETESETLSQVREYHLRSEIVNLVEVATSNPNEASKILKKNALSTRTWNYAEQYLILLTKAIIKQSKHQHEDVILLLEEAKTLKQFIVEEQLYLPIFSKGNLMLATSYAAVKDYENAYQNKKEFVNNFDDYSEIKQENKVSQLTEKYEIAHKKEENKLLDDQNKLKERRIGDVNQQQINQQKRFALIFCIILLFVLFFLRQLKVRKKLLVLAQTDSLTGLYNRTALFHKGQKLVKNASRSQLDLSVLLFDIDHFKSINDQFGHTVGDLVLEKIAVLVDETMRARDVFARLSGEEFVAVLPNTDLAQAKAIAVRVMEKISHYNFSKFGIDRNITLSIGVANINDTSAEFDDILHAADLAMYQAKAQGRNQMVSYESIAKDQERRQL